MKRIKLNAYAKINLSIDVTGKREDGYHDVVMVLQQIDLYDIVTVDTSEEDLPFSIDLTANVKAVPTGMDNIAWKAARLMADRSPDKGRGNVRIHIDKKIPMAAGVAGGSADAAAVLHALNILWECNRSVTDLMKIGVELGADVPFCIMAQAVKNRTLNLKKETVATCALAQGIGEKLTPLSPLRAFVVLSTPPVPVSTAEIYKSLDLHTIGRRPDTTRLIQGLQEQDFNRVKAAMYNVLEEVSIKKYPVIAENRRLLRSISPSPDLKIMMSGSGPTIFALTPDKKLADTILKEIQTNYTEKCPNASLVKTSY